MNRLQNTEELSDFLHVSRSTVERMAKAGEIPCIVLRKGKRKETRRFDPDMVKKHLEKNNMKYGIKH